MIVVEVRAEGQAEHEKNEENNREISL